MSAAPAQGMPAPDASAAPQAFPGPGAAAQRIASSGLWTVFNETGPDQRPSCGMSTAGADGRQIILRRTAGESTMRVTMDKPSWTIPDGIQVDVAFQFDNRRAVTEHAIGSQTSLTVTLPPDRATAFMRAIRRAAQIRVHFPSGDEPSWTGGLQGSSAMADAFDSCIARSTATPRNGAPTQPFDAPHT